MLFYHQQTGIQQKGRRQPQLKQLLIEQLTIVLIKFTLKEKVLSNTLGGAHFEGITNLLSVVTTDFKGF